MHKLAFWDSVFKAGVAVGWQMFLKPVKTALSLKTGCHSISQMFVKLCISPYVSHYSHINKHGALTEYFQYFKYCSKVIDFF